MNNHLTRQILPIFGAIVIQFGVANPCLANLTTDLQVYYQFDSNSNDSSGNSRNLDTFGNVGFASGLYGQAIDLHANASQYAERPVSDSILDFGSNSFTIQTWINFNSITSAEQTIIEKASNLGSPGWTISKITRSGLDELEFWSSGATGPLDTAPLSITTGVWHQLIVRRNEEAFDLFFDNSILAEALNSTSIIASPNPLLIGKRNPEDPRGGFPVDGRLDEVAIWTRALSNEEISSLYNGGRGLTISSVPLPSAVWLFSSALTVFCFVGKQMRMKR